jgi:DNA-binding NarL/FixJ family response regulator
VENETGTAPDDAPTASSRRNLDVLVVDHHRLVAESVARMLPQIDTVRTATSVSSLATARRVVRRGNTDVVLVDDRVGNESGLDLIGSAPLRGRLPPTVVVFSAAVRPDAVAQALQAGAAGWVSKDCSLDELAEALAETTAGRRWVSPGLRAGVIESLLGEARVPSDPGPARLTPRQRDVLRCLMEGLTHVETAERLHLSPSTVHTHVAHMCRVLDVHSTPALVALARGTLLVPTERSASRPV